MKLLGTLLLCCVILVNGQDDPITTTEATTTVTPPPETTTTPTTTEPPPKTTTNATTTTAQPSPAPAPPGPSPTPKPTPDYPHNSGKWSVEDKDNKTCIVFKAALQLTVIDKLNHTVSLSVSPASHSSGSCNDSQSIILTWDSSVWNANKTAFEKNTLALYFESNTTKELLSTSSGISEGKYGLQNITAHLYLDSNETTVDKYKPVVKTLVNKAVFQTPLNHSFSCLAEEIMRTDSGDFTVKIREVQLEAYRSTPAGHREFSAAVDCPADDATDVVPIAVGAALAGLVVIVLIAYLIGRKRSRARGYQSV